MSDTLKAREARLRRAAARQGLAVAKSRRRGAKAGYRIVDPQTDAVIRDGTNGDYSLAIEEVEAFLGDPRSTKAIAVGNLNAANDQ